MASGKESDEQQRKLAGKFQHGLRLEAQAVDFGRLSESQAEAARTISQAILGAYLTSSMERQDNHRNHILMVTGGKGSGKTTLILSLRHWFQEQDSRMYEEKTLRDAGLKDGTQQDNWYQERRRDVQNIIEKRNKIVWLDPLSLDPIFPGTNLVAAIFARISHAVARDSERDRLERGILEPVSALDRAFHELGSLRSDAAMALEGNLHDRAPRMDPESYAIAAIENERKKQEVAERFNKVLRRLLEGSKTEESKNGLFVLPIDDFDSSPERAVEMMKLAYTLSVPRLVFLFLGSIEVADQVLFYKTQGEFRNLLGQAGKAEALIELEATANEIASSALRKMIPPSQRIELTPLTFEHACRFRAEATKHETGTSAPQQNTLRELLKQVNFEPATFCTIRRPVAMVPLESILFARDPFVAIKDATKEEKFSHYIYDGLRVLQAAPRQLTDLYSFFAHPSRDQEQREMIYGLFSGAFSALVDEDGHLTPPVQQKLKSCLQKDPFSGDLELTPTDLEVATETGDCLSFSVDPLRLAGNDGSLLCRLEAKRVRNLGLRSVTATSTRSFSASTRTTFKVIHDLIRFARAGVITQPIPHRDLHQLAYTEWDDGVNKFFRVPWLSVEWRTFWHAETFFRIWNRGLQRIRTISSDKAELHPQDLGYLLALSASAGLIITASAASPDVEEWVEPTLKSALDPFLEDLEESQRKSGKKWFHSDLAIEQALNAIATTAHLLAEHVLGKRKSEGEDDDEADQIDSALINFILLLTPECGIPHIGGQIPSSVWLSNPKVIDLLGHGYVKTNLAPEIRKRRLKRLGENASTLLGIALLNPELALQIMEQTEDAERHACVVVHNSMDNYQVFGGDHALYCPSEDDLRHALLRFERIGWSGDVAAHEVARLKSFLMQDKHTYRCPDLKPKAPSTGGTPTANTGQPSQTTAAPKRQRSRKAQGIK